MKLSFFPFILFFILLSVAHSDEIKVYTDDDLKGYRKKSVVEETQAERILRETEEWKRQKEMEITIEEMRKKAEEDEAREKRIQEEALEIEREKVKDVEDYNREY